MQKATPISFIFIILFVLSACQTPPKAEVESVPTETAVPTNTPQPTPTPSPSPTPNAEMVLENSAVAMNALESVTQEQVSMLSAAIISNTQTQTCDYEQPTNAYCQIASLLVPPGSTRAIENKYEILFLDGEAWTRQDGRSEWDAVSEADAEALSLIAKPNTPFQLPQTAVLNVQMAGVTDLDGIAMYQLEAVVDETAVSSILGPSVQGLLAFTQNMELTTQLWVGVDDFLIYKQIIFATFTFQGQPVEFSTEITNSGFNEPKKFPDPSATT